MKTNKHRFERETRYHRIQRLAHRLRCGNGPTATEQLGRNIRVPLFPSVVQLGFSSEGLVAYWR